MGEESKEFVPLSKRPEWADIEPIPQYDESKPRLIIINYEKEYSDAMDIFRAIVKKNEFSERALELTEFLIDYNPANYSIWKYRQDILIKLNYDLKEELQKMEDITLETMKSYQIWRHRQFLIDNLNDPCEEMEFIKIIFEYDAKNYHTWAYRQWLMNRFNLFDESELEYIDQLLTEDIRNNSAWNQRMFYFNNRPSILLDVEAENEINYAIEKIKILPNNKCPWSYLKGIIKLNEKTLLDYPNIEELSVQLKDDKTTIFPLCMYYDISELKYLKNPTKEGYQNLLKLIEELENRDFRRVNYWNHKRINLQTFNKQNGKSFD
eukprot:jgi/Orpsp1_1/1174929/evm.model.c7180000051994.1